MDKVTAAMVLTSLSTSPLVRSPPVKVNGENHPYLANLNGSNRTRFTFLPFSQSHSAVFKEKTIKNFFSL